MGKFGYIGARPTQSSSSSSGVFSVNDVANALDQSIYPLQSFTASYLVIAGGGGGDHGSGGPGGGAGGYRNSYASETSGDSSSTETPITLNFNENITITVGAGGTGGVSASSDPTQGNSSVLGSISTVGGGLGGTFNTGGDGGSGG